MTRILQNAGKRDWHQQCYLTSNEGGKKGKYPKCTSVWMIPSRAPHSCPTEH